ncbi:MAG: phenylalanine--tRNA ligase subunit beta [Oscillospiraceae bacterium]|nr:phenylalanine--tRNA ligase subunit beta [Oscillospiraceae bacterium]
MILSRKWLNEFVDLRDVSDKQFNDAMTLSGSKVETVTREDAEIRNVVVGRIVEMVRHENSDHMWVCQIDVGGDAPVQIVTGAQNQKEGDLVIVALDDSDLPGGKHIAAGKLRGVASNGMCCSFAELGMTEHDWPYAATDGLFILQTDPDVMAKEPKPGDPIAAVLGCDDAVVEFEITPNRPDCLSVIGLAREASATFERPLTLHKPVVKGCGGSIAELVDIEIEDGALCPRYTARMVKNVKIAPSPLWLRERLRASGVRPINNIVDITNYVMLEYGQPMHAFDFSCVEGGQILVRTAREGESIRTLDGNERKLTTSMLCICDANKPVCVAGVMGGANSEIVGDTAMVLFESANFNGVSVRRTATALGMRTDASSRYEKGLDPMNTVKAVERACELVELLGCGEVVDGVMDVIARDKAETVIRMEPDKVNAFLGTDIPAAEQYRYLARVDIRTADGSFPDGDADVCVPSWRSDVVGLADLSEEVARFYGYNNIPSTLTKGETTRGGLTEAQRFERKLGETCRALGYDEIITYSFISPSYYDKIRMDADSPLRRSLKILNPLGEDTSIMRTTILPSMLEIVTRNYNYRNKSVRLYELGKIYQPRADGLADEPKMLALGAYGDELDFFAFKGAVEAILRAARIADVRCEACCDNSAYHPGRCAKVFSGETPLGVFGQVHPLVCTNYGVDTAVFAAELSFEALYALRGGKPEYRPLPKFPAATRDIAVVCAERVTVGALEDCIRSAAGGLLREVTLFDIYRGAGILPGRKSVAFSLVLRADDRSLTSEEADAAMKRIVAALGEQLDARLR